MKMRFLLDEHMALNTKTAISHRNPLIDVLRVGDPGASSLATPDPDILTYLELAQRALITKNRRSMMQHYGEHIAAGKSHCGSRRTGRLPLALAWDSRIGTKGRVFPHCDVGIHGL
jgi:hypothetical protein